MFLQHQNEHLLQCLGPAGRHGRGLHWVHQRENCHHELKQNNLRESQACEESRTAHDFLEPTSLGKSNIDVCVSLKDSGEGQRAYGTPDLKGFLNSCFHISS